MIYDGSGDGSYASLSEKIAGYRAKGQKVIGHYVTVDTDEAIRRMRLRGERTGRFVPETYLRETHKNISVTIPRAMTEGQFDEITLWDTNGPELLRVATSNRGGTITIYDEAGWQRFLAKGR